MKVTVIILISAMFLSGCELLKKSAALTVKMMFCMSVQMMAGLWEEKIIGLMLTVKKMV